MHKLRTTVAASLLSALFTANPPSAQAFPGFYVGKKESVGTAHAAHVAVMPKGDTTIVSVMHSNL